MAKKTKNTSEGFNEILLYTTPNGKVKVEIYLQVTSLLKIQYVQKLHILLQITKPIKHNFITSMQLYQ